MSEPWDSQARAAISSVAMKALPAADVNLVDIIARQRGWCPLVVGEKMTVHFDGKEYEIRRND